MAKVVMALTMLAAIPAAAFGQQKVKDFVEVEGMGVIELKGYAVVIGLNGNGDSPGGETERLITNWIKNHTNTPLSKLNIKNVAMVVVTARMRPFQKPGTFINIRVAALGDAKTLAGGTLLSATLRGLAPRVSKQGKIIYVVAQGRVIVEGSGREGNPTTGVVPSGGAVKKGIKV